MPIPFKSLLKATCSLLFVFVALQIFIPKAQALSIVHDTSAEFAAGSLNNVVDAGSGSNPSLGLYENEVVSDASLVGLWHMEDMNYDDSFTGTTIDSSKWSVINATTQNDRLIATIPNGSNGYSGQRGVQAQGKFEIYGDFDMQFDFDATNWTMNPSSDGNNGIINSIWFDLTTNAYNGAIVYVRSANAGLQGPATNLIQSVTTGNNILANDGTYGFQLSQAGTGNGTINRNVNCDTETEYCGPSLTNLEVFNTASKPIDDGRLRLDVAGAASYINNPGTYTDTLAFIAVPTY